MGIMSSVGTILEFALGLYSWIILIRVLLSWVNPDPYNPIVQFLIRATEPVLAPLRRIIPTLGGMDFSPIVAFLGISVLQRLVHAIFSSGSVGGAMFALLEQVMVLIYLILTFYMLLLVVRAGINIYSWMKFRQGQPTRLNLGHPLSRFVFQVTEPVVRPMRRFVPTVFGLELSPLVAAFLVVVLLSLLEQITVALRGFAMAGGGF
uniref:YggT family protein n=1 Tax=Magnetococcus massalia (strain MO-1) TaxID=451514 RepID=A0A1S7LL08_MAGMO|nr:conserved membrane protein of unknown function [Candidatus Magnetococcus massalia]